MKAMVLLGVIIVSMALIISMVVYVNITGGTSWEIFGVVMVSSILSAICSFVFVVRNLNDMKLLEEDSG